MNNYNKTFYAINKVNPESIIYVSDTGEIIKLSIEHFKSIEEFKKWKMKSDSLYLDVDRKDNAQTKKNISIYDFECSEECATLSPEKESIEREEEIFIQRCVHGAIEKSLTETQKRRVRLFYFKDLNTLQIAKIEDVFQNAVWESINASKIKLRKFLKSTGKKL